MEDDLQEWEMLHIPEESDLVDSSLSADSPKTLIRSDYFAFGSDTTCVDAISPRDVISEVEDLIEINDCRGGGGEEGGSEVPVLEEIKDFEGNPNNNNNKMGGGGEEIEVREGLLELELEGSNDGVSEMVNSSSESDEINGGGGIVNHLEENKKMVWWKHPFELLKFCVFRVSPVWTLSLAAAVVGILILNKRLSRIKQKSRTIPIKLTVEDKKVSQFMVRAARLNEAFSVVRRVPIIRPILPSGGVTPWPALNLR